MSLSDCQHLNFERRDQGVPLITLNRPESCNATGEQMHGELARVGADVPAGPGHQRRRGDRYRHGVLREQGRLRDAGLPRGPASWKAPRALREKRTPRFPSAVNHHP